MRKRAGRRPAASEQVIKTEDRIGKINPAVIVDVCCIEAHGWLHAEKEIANGTQRIGDIEGPAGIGIAPEEFAAGKKKEADLE